MTSARAKEKRTTKFSFPTGSLIYGEMDMHTEDLEELVDALMRYNSQKPAACCYIYLTVQQLHFPKTITPVHDTIQQSVTHPTSSYVSYIICSCR